GTAICCSIVSLPSDVQQVHLGEHGTLQAPTKPEILIDFTTSSPGMAERLAEHATAHGAMALDAPVSGGDVGAREGRLSIMVGGPEAAFQSAQPLFEHLGKTIVHHGDPGAGQRAKLVNQILVAGGMLGLAEAMAFCEQSGLNHERVLQSVSAGAAGSWAVDHLAPRVARGDFDPGFFVAHLKKDLGLVLEAGADLGLPLPAMQLAFKAYQALSENGMGTLGTQALAGVASGKLGEVPGFSPQHS
ncbi:MAG: NAD(P)-dependent oxidoreductase, partial [Phycisphaerales bacterium]|nr:NAD(P)-dependent oxidoreductase [Phycisphaerales bacterium]